MRQKDVEPMQPTLTEIASLVMAALACIGVVIQWKRVKPEQRSLEGSTALAYAQAAEKSAERAEEAQMKLEQKEKIWQSYEKSWQAKFDLMQAEIDTLKTERLADRAVIAEWQLGIRRLIAQFESMNVVPVWIPKIVEGK